MGQLALPYAYKFLAKNATGATLSVVSFSFIRSLINASGVLSYEATAISQSAISALGNGSAVALGSGAGADVFSNSSSFFMALDGIFTVKASTTTSGSVGLYMAISPDDGTTFSDDADLAVSNHLQLGLMYFSGAETKSIPIEL